MMTKPRLFNPQILFYLFIFSFLVFLFINNHRLFLFTNERIWIHWDFFFWLTFSYTNDIKLLALAVAFRQFQRRVLELILNSVLVGMHVFEVQSCQLVVTMRALRESTPPCDYSECACVCVRVTEWQRDRPPKKAKMVSPLKR